MTPTSQNEQVEAASVELLGNEPISRLLAVSRSSLPRTVRDDSPTNSNTDQRILEQTGAASDTPQSNPLLAATTPTESQPSTWHHPSRSNQKRVKVAIENIDMPHGLIVLESVAAHPLLSTAPALHNYLTIEKDRIVLPWSEALDEDVLLDVINGMVVAYEAGKPFSLDRDSLVHSDPVTLVKLHVVFELLAIREEANSLLEALWDMFQSHELGPDDVFWLWSAFGCPWSRSLGYDAPHAEEYVQMMVWQILNLRVTNKMNPDIADFFIEWENTPTYFTNMLQERYEKYRLGRECLPGKANHEAEKTDSETEGKPSPQVSVVETSEEIVEAVRGAPRQTEKPAHTQLVTPSLPEKAAEVFPVYKPTLRPKQTARVHSLPAPLTRAAPVFYSSGFQNPLAPSPPSPQSTFFLPSKPIDYWKRTPNHGGLEAQYGPHSKATRMRQLVAKPEGKSGIVADARGYSEFGVIGGRRA